MSHVLQTNPAFILPPFLSQDVKDYLAEKTLDVELCFQPPDDCSGAVVGAAARMPRLESKFQVRFNKLSLTTSGLQNGSLKEDYSIPLEFYHMEPALLRLSVSVVRDESLPPQIAEVGSLMKEKGVFWPPPAYHDSSPLPEPWLGMLQQQLPAKSVAGKGQEKESVEEKSTASGHSHRDRGGATQHTSSASAAGKEGDEKEKTETEIMKDEGLPAARALIRDTFAALANASQKQQSTADAAGGEEEDAFTALLNGTTGVLGTGGLKAGHKAGRRGSGGVNLIEEDEDDDEEGSEGADNFGGMNGDQHHMRGRGGDESSSDDEYDYDDELPTYAVIKAIFQALRKAEEEEVDVVGARGANGELSEGFILMRLAVEQLLQAESLPENVSLANFSYILEECLSWARTQRVILRSAGKEEEQAATKNNVGTMSKTRYLPEMEKPTALNIAKVRRASHTPPRVLRATSLLIVA